jgi:hypothetical protein
MNFNDPTEGAAPAQNRTAFVLAGVGAILASLYWAGLTGLIGLGAATGGVSPVQMILPIFLIVLYGWRGVQLFKGDPAAARRILWLHGAGGVIALYEVVSNEGFVRVLYGIKIAVHIFGGLTALLAVRASSANPSAQFVA